MLKAYEVYMDDGHDTFKLYVPAEDPADVMRYVQGNGEVIAVRESEAWIDLGKLFRDLKTAGWDKAERDLIFRTLERATKFGKTEAEL